MSIWQILCCIDGYAQANSNETANAESPTWEEHLEIAAAYKPLGS
jgi:hypothetical protein